MVGIKTMAKRIANPKKLLKAAGVVPVFYPPGGSEPHFLMMRRRLEKGVGGGLEVIALAGFKSKRDAHLGETAGRETSEEGDLPVRAADRIGTLKTYFAPGLRGTLYVHHYEHYPLIEQLREKINAGVHPEFDRARELGLTEFEAELGWKVDPTLVGQGLKIAKIVRDWLQASPPSRKRA